MARVLVVPDPHLKTEVIERGIELADKLFCDRIVVLGDYFDDWDANIEDYEKMAAYLKKQLRLQPGRLVLLLGNHELSYMGFPCSGHKKGAESILTKWLEADNRFIWCYAEDGVLYSHAGFTDGWVRENKIVAPNFLDYHFKKGNGAATCEKGLAKMNSIAQMAQVGQARGGRDPHPSPLWADLMELVSDPVGTFIQVVGHTPVKQIEFYNHCYFCDVYSNGNVSDEYLFVHNGDPRILHYDEIIKGGLNPYELGAIDTKY